MRVTFFSSKPYDEQYVGNLAKTHDIECHFYDTRLTPQTAFLAKDSDVICAFVNDKLDAGVFATLAGFGVKHVALRCAGFNNVDIAAAKAQHIRVSRVPAYSPEAVAEHALALILTLNRKLHKAYNRVKEDNFNLNGLLGFNLTGKTIGVIGTGEIGGAFCRLLQGFNCRILASDPIQSEVLTAQGVEYTSLENLLESSHIVSLHCPLNKQTHHIINTTTLNQMQNAAMLINTSRGGLIDTQAVIGSLKSGKLGYLGLDVYEMESELFFDDHSDKIIQDDVFQRLLTFPNVLITGHQGFFTHDALTQIAQTTVNNMLFQGNVNENPNFLC